MIIYNFFLKFFQYGEKIYFFLKFFQYKENQCNLFKIADVFYENQIC